MWHRWRIQSYKLAVYLIGLAIAAIMFLPIYWLIVCSFKSTETLFEPILFPRAISLEGYLKVMRNPMFKTGFLNSSIVASSATLLSLIMSALAGYGFSRFRFAGRNFLLMFTLFNRMFPAVMLAITYFFMITRVGLYDSLFSLVLMDTIIVMPFSLWIMKNFFDTIPKEIEEAALIDGCSQLGTLFRIVLPLSKTGIASVAIYSFLMIWQEFFYAFVFTSSQEKRLVPVVIYEFFGQFFTDYTGLFATSVIFILPLILLFIFAQRYLIKGFTAGSLK